MRPDWDTYFLEIAKVVSTRSTCERKHVGAIIVVNGCIVSTGFNGAPRGLPHCDDVGHDMVSFVVPVLGDVPQITRESCVRTVHAEANAVAQAARRGVAIEGGILYTTASCCTDCAKLLINAGIKEVVAQEKYQSRYGKSDSVDEMFHQAGVVSRLIGQTVQIPLPWDPKADLHKEEF